MARSFSGTLSRWIDFHQCFLHTTKHRISRSSPVRFQSNGTRDLFMEKELQNTENPSVIPAKRQKNQESTFSSEKQLPLQRIPLSPARKRKSTAPNTKTTPKKNETNPQITMQKERKMTTFICKSGNGSENKRSEENRHYREKQKLPLQETLLLH